MVSSMPREILRIQCSSTRHGVECYEAPPVSLFLLIVVTILLLSQPAIMPHGGAPKVTAPDASSDIGVAEPDAAIATAAGRRAQAIRGIAINSVFRIIQRCISRGDQIA